VEHNESWHITRKVLLAGEPAMALRGLLYVLLAAGVTGVPPSSAQFNPGGAAASSGTMEQRIDRLLQHESEALELLQKQLLPAIRCDQGAKDYRETCHDMRTKLKDEAQKVQQDIALYRTSRQPVDLFDDYVDLQFLWKDIQIFGIADECNGDRNREPLVRPGTALSS
jgi:hypothetical protein